MANEELLVISQPYVCFDSNTPSGQSLVQWDRTPIVIVRVTALGYDVPAEVVSPFKLVGAIRVWLFPVLDNVLDTAIDLCRSKSTYQCRNERDVCSSQG